MPKPPRPWIVTRHDPLAQLDDNLWAVESDVPGFPPGAGFNRRMSIVRLSDGRLLFHNAVPVDDATLAQVRALGQPAILIVPHHLHAIDAHAFRERLGLDAYTAPESLDKTRAILPIAGTFDETPADPAFTVEPLPCSRFGERAVVVKSGPRVSLLLCDLVTNVPHQKSAIGFLFRILGFTGPAPKLPPLVRLRAFPDRQKDKADLLRLAAIPGLQRVVPSHGGVIADDAAGALRRVAESL